MKTKSDPGDLRQGPFSGAIVLALWIAASGCASGSTDAGEDRAPPRPISEVLESGPEFVDINSNSATLLATTKLDMACSVVYGPTTEFGSLATDTDMAGGAHSNHHPLLTGLEPDTLYYARMQGTAKDGATYRSELYTFRTLPAEAQNLGTNLALAANGGAVIGVSSNYGGGPNTGTFGADHAIDADPTTEWSSDGDGDAAWIEIGLAERTRVSSIGLWTRTMGSSAQIESFQVVTDQGEVFGPFALSDAGGVSYFDTDMLTQQLRFEVVSSSGGNTGVVEIEVYGEPTP